MAEFVASSKSFFTLGMSMIMKHKKLNSFKYNTENNRVFKQNFGVSPLVLFKCWSLLMKHCDKLLIKPSLTTPNKRILAPKHLLWTCLFLKSYGKESTNSSIAGTTQKTFRLWVWTVVKQISALEPYVVSDMVNHTCTDMTQ